MKLVELLDNPLPYHIEETRHGYAAIFRYNNHSYMVEADVDYGGPSLKDMLEREGNGPEIREMAPEWFDNDEIFYHVTFRDADKEFGDGEYDLTNRGDAIKVLSTVADFTMKVVKKGANRIFFSADTKDEGRARVYLRMVRRANPKKITTIKRLGEIQFYIEF